MFAALGMLSKLRELHPDVAKGVDALIGSLAGDPGVVDGFVRALNELARLKDMSVEELIKSGTLGRVLLEKATTGVVAPEVRSTAYSVMRCPHCGEFIYDKEEYHVRKDLEN